MLQTIRACRGRTKSSLAFVSAVALIVPPTLAQADQLKIRQSFTPFGGQAAIFLAVERGWLKDITIEDGNGSVAALNLTAAGQADVGEASIAAMETARAKGLPLKAIAGWFPQTDAGVMTAPGIKTPKELEGKKVGYAASSLEGPFVVPFLRESGADLSKIELINMDFSSRVPSYLSGKIDAFFSSVPYSLAILKPTKKPTEAILMSQYGFYLPGNGYVATEQTIAKKAPVLKNLVAAVSRAWSEIWANEKVRDEAIDAMIRQRPNAKLDRANLTLQLESFRTFYFTPNTKGKPIGWISPKDMESAINTMKKVNLVPASAKAEDSYTNRFFE